MTAARVPSASLTWIRGHASLDGMEVRLQPQATSLYAPLGEPGLLWDFLAIVDQDDVVAFASRYGLLRAGPGSELHEPLSSWWDDIAVVRGALTLHLDVATAQDGGDDDRAAFRSRWHDSLPDAAAPLSDDELFAEAQGAVTWALNRGLVDAEIGVEAMPQGGAGRRYVFNPRPPSLLGLIYYRAALTLVDDVPLACCLECGTLYPVRDRRQRYCSEQHASRARYLRHRERHAGDRSLRL